jgi:hypothetical protein
MERPCPERLTLLGESLAGSTLVGSACNKQRSCREKVSLHSSLLLQCLMLLRVEHVVWLYHLITYTDILCFLITII